MIKLPIQICSEDSQYYSDLPVDTLKAEIKKMLEKTWGFSFSTNMTGEFLSDNEFQISPKWRFGVYSYPGRIKPTTIYGTIFQGEENVTQIKLTITPSPIFSTIFIFVPGLMGAVTVYSVIKGILDIPSAIVMICFTIVFSYVLLDISKLSKFLLLNRFVSYFNLDLI